MNRVLLGLSIAGALCLPGMAQAEDARLAFGGDMFAAGQYAQLAEPVANDAFLAGYDVSITAPVTGDAHIAGYNVSVTSSVGGGLYAMGFAVNLTGSVGGDVTAAGNSVLLKLGTPVAGNVRLAGATVTIDTPITGAALASAGTLSLNAPIDGDFSFYGENITFGPNATISGKVAIHAPNEIAVPAAVASADRVTFEKLVNVDYVGEGARTAETVVKGFWPAVWGSLLWGLFLLVIGALFIAFMPRGVAAMQSISEKRPFRRIGLGILAFASVVGLVPVVALTLVGLLLVPVVVIFAIVACILAYLAGTYYAASNIGGAFLKIDTNLKRIAALAIGLIVAALIVMIPFIGWLITLGIVAFGFGVIAAVIMVRWSAPDAARIDTPTAG
ncbi:MAG TPA: hypothetical protein VG757_13030 [Devosia sp.]|nr:hypothetical protein [Devosia sp.]